MRIAKVEREGVVCLKIDGRLDANGQVYIVNPNGVIFGRDAGQRLCRQAPARPSQVLHQVGEAPGPGEGAGHPRLGQHPGDGHLRRGALQGAGQPPQVLRDAPAGDKHRAQI